MVLLKESQVVKNPEEILVPSIEIISQDLSSLTLATTEDDLAGKLVDIEDNNDVKFDTVDIPGKGQGMIATTKIYPGDVIYAETPLIIVPDDIFNDVVACEEYLERKINLLSSSERELLLGLIDCRNADETFQYCGKFYTNAMNYDGDAAICPIIARANHSCRPNAEFVSRPDLGKQLLVAMYIIEEGEEICINYMPMLEEGTDIREVRQSYLRKWYGFQCCCRACTLQGVEFENDESSRKDIKELQAAGLENLDLAEIEELIRLTYHIYGKLTYIIDLFDSLYRKAAEGSLRRLEYAVSGFTLAVNIYGGGSREASNWKNKVDYEKYFITISSTGDEIGS